MPPQTIERRVEKLEEQMTTLQQLPARTDALSAQISQLREDLGAKISTMDARISGTEKSLREEILASGDRILTRVRMLHEDVISRLAPIQEGRRERSRSPRKK